jgi:hypothetical protein
MEKTKALVFKKTLIFGMICLLLLIIILIAFEKRIDKLISEFQKIVNSQKDYANGRYFTSTPQLTETTFVTGASLDAGYYKVEIGAVVYATKTYNVDDGFYATAGTNFSTSASGIARLFTGGQQERSATIQIQFKQQGIESNVIKLIIGSTGNIVNYQSNDPSTFKITYGNGDSSFDSGNAFPLYAINSYKILEQTMQNGDRSAVI